MLERFGPKRISVGMPFRAFLLFFRRSKLCRMARFCDFAWHVLKSRFTLDFRRHDGNNARVLACHNARNLTISALLSIDIKEIPNDE